MSVDRRLRSTCVSANKLLISRYLVRLGFGVADLGKRLVEINIAFSGRLSSRAGQLGLELPARQHGTLDVIAGYIDDQWFLFERDLSVTLRWPVTLSL